MLQIGYPKLVIQNNQAWQGFGLGGYLKPILLSHNVNYVNFKKITNKILMLYTLIMKHLEYSTDLSFITIFPLKSLHWCHFQRLK